MFLCKGGISFALCLFCGLVLLPNNGCPELDVKIKVPRVLFLVWYDPMPLYAFFILHAVFRYNDNSLVVNYQQMKCYLYSIT